MERFAWIAKSINCFVNQDYKNRELIIVVDRPNARDLNRLNELMRGVKSPKIKVHISRKKLSLGALRNRGIALSSGSYICQWDDDDFSHPTRIRTQINFLLRRSADAAYLTQSLYYFSEQNLLFVMDWRRSPTRCLCGTLIAKKGSYLNYHNLAVAEDTKLWMRLSRLANVAYQDNAPHLYIYNFHGSNTWSYFEHARRALAYSIKRAHTSLPPSQILKYHTT